MSAKKLVLLIGVMLICGAILQKSYSTDTNCPHPKFLLKHHCQGEASVENALAYSIARNNKSGVGKSDVNTVFFGVTDYVLGQDGRCINRVIGLVLLDDSLFKL